MEISNFQNIDLDLIEILTRVATPAQVSNIVTLLPYIGIVSREQVLSLPLATNKADFMDLALRLIDEGRLRQPCSVASMTALYERAFAVCSVVGPMPRPAPGPETPPARTLLAVPSSSYIRRADFLAPPARAPLRSNSKTTRPRLANTLQNAPNLPLLATTIARARFGLPRNLTRGLLRWTCAQTPLLM